MSLSELKLTHAPLHAVVPVAVHVKPHVEPLHVAVPPVGAKHWVQFGPHALGPFAVHVPPHRFVPVGHWHADATHCSPPVQASPQPWQFAGSLVVSTQDPEQFVNPLLHAMPHALFAHVGCPCVVDGHAFPHVPQLAALEVVSTHVPLHSVGVPVGQPVTHA
ncbi:MAG: hypothetical protein ABSE49_19125 [Polyangiaceae bacterium]